MTTASDAFPTNGANLGASWTEAVGTISVASNAATGQAGTDCLAYFPGSWANDHTSEATVGNILAGTRYAGVAVRASGTGATARGYGLITDGSAGGLLMTRWDTGSVSVINTIGAVAFTAGDVIKLGIAGTTLTAYKNGASVGTFTDTTYATGGAPGLESFDVATMDNWTGADIIAGSPVGMAVETDTAIALLPPAGASPCVESDIAIPLPGINFAQREDLFQFGDDTGYESSAGGIKLFGGFAAAGATGAAGVASETDSALTLATVAIRAAGLASETDTAFARAPLQIRAAGLSSEADTAFAFSALQIKATGLAAESDTALSLTAGSSNAPGIAAEDDAAITLAGVQIKALGLAAETDSALALTRVVLLPTGVASESDSGLALAPVQIAAVGLSNESDTAIEVLPAGPMPLGMATEVNTALALLPAVMAVEQSGGFPDHDTLAELARRRKKRKPDPEPEPAEVVVVAPDPAPRKTIKRAQLLGSAQLPRTTPDLEPLAAKKRRERQQREDELLLLL